MTPSSSDVQERLAPFAPSAPGWPRALAALGTALAAALLTFGDTASSIVRVWSHSETFAHGFLIVPVSAYLVWVKRRELAALAPHPYPYALGVLPLFGFLWLAGHATSTLQVEQFCFVSFIPLLTLATLGPRVTRTIAFPLGFLYFAVPFGDVFQLPLMKLTAEIAVRALQVSGVSVATTGLHIYTHTAHWRVIEACSGLNYLVSGLALASLFSYLTYRKTWKRLACVGLVVVVLIAANGVRAYLVILYGELSDMNQGRGFDHYAFGWVLYLVVMGIYLALASAFADPRHEESLERSASTLEISDHPPTSVAGWVRITAMSVGLLAAWPALYASLAAPRASTGSHVIAPPNPRDGWTISARPSEAWRPRFAGAAAETLAAFRQGERSVTCYIATYEGQGEGRELIQYRNALIDAPDPRWRVVGESTEHVRLDAATLGVRQTDIRTPQDHLVLWEWYWLPDEFTPSPAWSKVLQARATLLLRRDRAAVIVLAARGPTRAIAAGHLTEFARDMLPSIRASVRQIDSNR